LLGNFNLIISTYRNRENDCISEVWFTLKDLGIGKINVSKTGLPGLIVARIDKNPIEVVEKIRELAETNPWNFHFILKIVPIETVIETNLDKIKSVALKFAEEKIGPEETYKIDPVIRLSTLRRSEVIEAIAPYIKNKVNLENPDKILRIEIIGSLTGISVLKPQHILSIVKIRREKRVH